MIVSCGHPEWPAFAFPANGAISIKTLQEGDRSLTESVKTAPVVRAGDIVRLWRQESLLRIEVAGVSEESGGLGNTIRVRLLRRNPDDQSIPEQFSGVVRGPSNVEIQP
jgi:flagella basal body P-ring formation protein FlgA